MPWGLRTLTVYTAHTDRISALNLLSYTHLWTGMHVVLYIRYIKEKTSVGADV